MKNETKTYYVNKVDRTKLGKFSKVLRLTVEEKQQIKSYKGILTPIEIAEQFNCKESTVMRLWKEDKPKKDNTKAKTKPKKAKKITEAMRKKWREDKKEYRHRKRALIDANVL